MTRFVASIEARMASSRLPGKMAADIGGKPVLRRLIDRLKRASTLDAIVVATTTDPSDDILAEIAKSAGVACFRGSENDVLRRVVEAQRSQKSDVVVEICGDCPMLDFRTVEAAISAYKAGLGDVVTTTVTPSWPQGNDVQVFAFRALEWVSAEIQDPAVREHVSLYFYENPGKYRIHSLIAPPTARRPDIRCQLDYAEDLDFIRSIWDQLVPDIGTDFRIDDVCALVDRRPELLLTNMHCVEKSAR